MSVVIETTIGSMTVDLHCDLRPRTCLNFLKLCKLKYYNFCPFHRITKDFIAQSGELIYNGREGGESVFHFLYGENGRYFEPESKVKLKHNKFGTVAMVTSEAKLCGSQFFFTLSDSLDYLDDVHTVFGRVVDGFEVLHELNQLLCDQDDKPYRDVLITHTTVLHDPFEDPAALEYPERSPSPSEQLLNADTIFIKEGYDENDGKTKEEIEEETKDKDAKAKAIVLEMIGDLPDADVAPPDNVLFVCKLNPVTRTEDLQVIFSRFGKIVECEVIRDQKTEESLQYAFIEFEKPQDCEQAYFKMNNVLIDDRRIHVDFSQSVAKFKWNRKSQSGRSQSVDSNSKRAREWTKSSRNDSRRNETRNHRPTYEERRRSRSVSRNDQSRNGNHGNRSRSPKKQRLRSPGRQRSRSPKRQRSRSPRRQRSRSPRRQRSRSPKRQRSRSPRRQRSRSPKRQRSRSPRRQRSRSPRRNQVRPVERRSRSRSKSRDRFPNKKASSYEKRSNPSEIDDRYRCKTNRNRARSKDRSRERKQRSRSGSRSRSKRK
jgi:peptidyl-prolyl cis-trans isomerase-like 4